MDLPEENVRWYRRVHATSDPTYAFVVGRTYRFTPADNDGLHWKTLDGDGCTYILRIPTHRLSMYWERVAGPDEVEQTKKETRVYRRLVQSAAYTKGHEYEFAHVYTNQWKTTTDGGDDSPLIGVDNAAFHHYWERVDVPTNKTETTTENDMNDLIIEPTYLIDGEISEHMGDQKLVEIIFSEQEKIDKYKARNKTAKSTFIAQRIQHAEDNIELLREILDARVIGE